MRIALFTETFLPKIDGIVNTLCHLLHHLEARGHPSILFAPAGGPKRFAATEVLGIGSLPLPVYPELRMVNPLTDVRAPLEAFRPDLIHVLSPFFLGVAGIRTARRLGVPLVASYHTDVPGYCRRYGFGFLEGPCWRYLRWLHNQAALNLCPSSVTLRELERRRVRNPRVWTRGVDTGRFSPEWRSPEMREFLTGGNPASTLLLYVGRVAPEKRVEWLGDVLEGVPDARLAVVGGGPGLEKLRARLEGTPTVFAGYLGGAELAKAYASSDVFAFPSANETFGNVVLEACASGLPVVTPDSGGVLDIVRHEENGLLFDAESRPGFVAAVRRLVDDPDLARRLGCQGRETALSRSWTAVLDGLMEDYVRVARAEA